MIIDWKNNVYSFQLKVGNICSERVTLRRYLCRQFVNICNFVRFFVMWKTSKRMIDDYRSAIWYGNTCKIPATIFMEAFC